MHKTAFWIINGLTLYRLTMAPILIVLALSQQLALFKWLLPVSFFTDFIDGFLARKFEVTSRFGARLDSIGDDITVLAGLVGLVVFEYQFVREQLGLLALLIALFIVQVALSLYRYGQMSSFHTYMAKAAALLQGLFLIIAFIATPFPVLFYLAAVVTGIELLEEIVLVLMLPKWQMNVKGLYWVWRHKSRKPTGR